MGTTVTVAVTQEVIGVGNMRFIAGTFTMPSDYESPGGSGLDLSTYLSEIYWVGLTARTGYRPSWDKANKKIKMYEAGADGDELDEVADQTDLSSEVLDFIAFGL